jgi:hypothetical protein
MQRVMTKSKIQRAKYDGAERERYAPCGVHVETGTNAITSVGDAAAAAPAG